MLQYINAYIVGTQRKYTAPVYYALQKHKNFRVKHFRINVHDVRDIEREYANPINNGYFELEPGTTPFVVHVIAVGAKLDQVMDAICDVLDEQPDHQLVPYLRDDVTGKEEVERILKRRHLARRSLADARNKRETRNEKERRMWSGK